MKKLSKEEKAHILNEWSECACDECLLKLARKVLDAQLKNNSLRIK